jgi:hypothetical protein
MKFAIPGPKTIATMVPMTVKIATMESPKKSASKSDFLLDFCPCIKNETVIGIIGNTQGVNKAISPLPNAIQKSFQRFLDEVGSVVLLSVSFGSSVIGPVPADSDELISKENSVSPSVQEFSSQS